jgi:hypothetical protein
MAPPAHDPRRLRAELLAAARAYLDHADGPAALPLTVRVGRGEAEHRFKGGPDGEALRVDSNPLEAFLLAHFLSPLELAVCRCLLPGPRSFEGIGGKLPDPPGDTKLRTILAQLGRRGLIDTGDDGYFLVAEELREVLRRLEP